GAGVPAREVAEAPPVGGDGKGRLRMDGQFEAEMAGDLVGDVPAAAGLGRQDVPGVQVRRDHAETKRADEKTRDPRRAGPEEVALFSGGQAHVGRDGETSCPALENPELASKHDVPDAGGVAVLGDRLTGRAV